MNNKWCILDKGWLIRLPKGHNLMLPLQEDEVSLNNDNHLQNKTVRFQMFKTHNPLNLKKKPKSKLRAKLMPYQSWMKTIEGFEKMC